MLSLLIWILGATLAPGDWHLISTTKRPRTVIESLAPVSNPLAFVVVKSSLSRFTPLVLEVLAELEATAICTSSVPSMPPLIGDI